MIIKSERIYSLDILRGVASIGVVFWHWRMLWSGKVYFVEDLPLYNYFFAFYEKGWLAVDLFFMLSGFIFSWLYADVIAERYVNAKKYAILRFSRLYPLHIITLLLVLVCQGIYFLQEKKFYIYDNNDIYHFLLNLFLMSSWGMERGLSFNAPIWSVSVEVFLYGIFFITAFLITNPSRRLIVWGLLSISGYFLIISYYAPIGRGVGSFFLGACLHPVFLFLIGHRYSRFICGGVIGIAFISWILVLVSLRMGLVFNYRFYTLITRHYPVKILFPLTILSLLIIEPYFKPWLSRISLLGDISYATYLLHFPLQLMFVIFFGLCGVSVFEDYVFYIYFIFVLGASMLSFHFFERPAQKFIRKIFGM